MLGTSFHLSPNYMSLIAHTHLIERKAWRYLVQMSEWTTNQRPFHSPVAPREWEKGSPVTAAGIWAGSALQAAYSGRNTPPECWVSRLLPRVCHYWALTLSVKMRQVPQVSPSLSDLDLGSLQGLWPLVRSLWVWFETGRILQHLDGCQSGLFWTEVLMVRVELCLCDAAEHHRSVNTRPSAR